VDLLPVLVRYFESRPEFYFIQGGEGCGYLAVIIKHFHLIVIISLKISSGIAKNLFRIKPLAIKHGIQKAYSSNWQRFLYNADRN
jgi:hypothetical protein